MFETFVDFGAKLYPEVFDYDLILDVHCAIKLNIYIK